MATNNTKCGWTEEERVKFLRDHGFVEVRQGKGTHSMWEHPELKRLAKIHTIEAPPNILQSTGQKPWDMPMCDNPANGTWHVIRKQAEWCAQKVSEIHITHQKQRLHREIKVAFLRARREICAWKKEQKNWLKAGLPLSGAPQAPEDYHNYDQIRAAVQQFLSKKRDPFFR